MSLRARLLLAVGSGGTTLLLAWWLLDLGGEERYVELVDRGAETERVLATREYTGASLADERIPKEVARTLFLLGKPYIWDPDCYYRYRPNLERPRTWEEHPDGEWTRRTNAQGLREDDDARLSDADLGVLVTGDSHTDGACNNDESFANVLEERLAARDPDRRVEVLNAGVVGYSFHNYLGVLRRFLDEDPDVFVVCVYGGNDFANVLAPHHYLTGTPYPPRRTNYWDRIEKAKEVSQTFVAQSLHQALFLQEHPEELGVALEGSLAVMARIAELCRERDIRLVVAYLPPAYEASWPELDRLVERAMEHLDLNEADLYVTRRLEERFFEGLRALGVEPIDLGPALRASGERCYWETDLHLNVTGHAVVAEVLERHLAAGGGELGLPSRLPDGPHEERDGSGRLLARGSWLDGRRAGEWVRYYPSGAERSRGRWEDGRRVGEWAWSYESGGPMKQGRFENGERTGLWREWYRDETLRREGAFRDGRPHGEWREWHPDGELGGITEYADGEREGTWIAYREDGSLETRVQYRDDVLHGEAERRHPNGALQWRGRFEDGEREGPWRFERPDGTALGEGRYAGGQRVGPWRFWKPNGTIDAKKSGIYRDGERVADLEEHP